MEMRFACIVEGHGDALAVPDLVRRIARSSDPAGQLRIEVFRVPKSRLVLAGEVEKRVEIAARRVGRRAAILILIDSDDDCPAALGPELLARASTAHPDLSLGVVLAKREFEAWFLAAAESLRGWRGLSDDLAAPREPEAVRGAKELLRQRFRECGRDYTETADQRALTWVFDLELAGARSPSFEKCHREIIRLLSQIRIDPRRGDE